MGLTLRTSDAPSGESWPVGSIESGDLTKMDAVGFDRQARLLELVATRLDGGTWLFHHADLARPGFVKELLT